MCIRDSPSLSLSLSTFSLVVLVLIHAEPYTLDLRSDSSERALSQHVRCTRAFGWCGSAALGGLIIDK
eukprot:2494767-Rhodomonas_salina.1